jgi:SAM-dependent methyltransferase
LRPTILRANATGVYRFLNLIRGRLAEGETLEGRRILDCGAGGRVPPLSIFAEQGMDCVGIDISEGQVEAARAYAAAHELPIEFRLGDMREIPFPDASFDYVYEHFSMCHLSKADTARAIEEIRRALKPAGTAFLGVISSESWPLSFYGEEREPGEFWMVEGGEEARHSVFTDEECQQLVSGWEVLSKERVVFHHGGEDLTDEAWQELHEEAPQAVSGEVWRALYPRRRDVFRYVHAYYLLRKPS